MPIHARGRTSHAAPEPRTDGARNELRPSRGGGGRARPASRTRRILRGFALAVGGVVVLYLVVMNVLLRTRLLRVLVDGSPKDVLIEYAGAYSIVPGTIHADELIIRGSDMNVQWILRLDSCTFRAHFLDFFHRQFHASHVRGDGVSFRIRMRTQPGASAEHLAALPPVPGFPDPPLADPGPPPPPLPDSQYRLWSIRLDDVVATRVREIWVDTVRMDGAMTVKGRWLFRPVRWLEVGPATVDLDDVEVAYGRRPLATHLRGSFRTTVHGYDVRIPSTRQTLDYLSFDGDLRADLKAANLFAVILAADPDIEPLKGDGPLDANLRMDHGRLLAGTHVNVALPETTVRVNEVEATGAVVATVEVANEASGKPRGTAHLDGSTFVLAAKGGREAEVKTFVFDLTSHELRLSENPTDDRFTLNVQGVEVLMAPWVPASPGLKVLSGRLVASLQAAGSLHDAQGSGALSFDAPSLSVQAKAVRIQGDAHGRIVVDGAALQEGHFVLGKSHVELAKLRGTTGSTGVGAKTVSVTAFGDMQTKATRATATLAVAVDGVSFDHAGVAWGMTGGVAAEATGGWDGKASTVTLGEAAVALTDVVVRSRTNGEVLLKAPDVDALGEGVEVGPAGVRGAASIDLGAVQALRLGELAALAHLPQGLGIEGGSARIHGRARIELPTGRTSGQISVTAQDFALRIGQRHVEGGATLNLLARATGGGADLSGSSFAFQGASKDKSLEGWWAEVRLPHAWIAPGRGRFDGVVELKARDARPIEETLSVISSVPGWVAFAAPFPHLTGQAELRVGPGRLEVRSLSASGGQDAVRLELESAGPKKEWALLVDTGTLRAALHRHDDKTDLQLFDVQPWFQGFATRLQESEPKTF